MAAAMDFTDLSAYGAILKRRKLSFLLPFVFIALIAAAFAYLLPPTFRSEATILIKRQSIPPEYVETTVTGYVQEQIEQIRQRISTYQNLLDIANKFELYADTIEQQPQETVRAVAQGISVKMVNVTASSPDQRGERQATVAFTVAFEYSDAEIARAVTNELASRYLEEHQAVRGEISAEVSVFLGEQVAALEVELGTMETQLAEFKQSKIRELPELINMNLKLFETTENNIASTETRIRQLEDQQDARRAELSLISPYVEVQSASGERLQSGAERLSSLTLQYLQLIGRYSEKHPDVVKLAREIRVLAEQNGSGARADEVMRQLAQQQESLRQAKQQYGNDHPEITRLEKSISALQLGLQAATVSSQNTRTKDIAPDNPRYVGLQSQLRATESNLKAEAANLQELKARLTEYEERIFKTPIVDRDQKALSRDYDNTKQKYRDLKAKWQAAQLAEVVERGGNAQRFELSSSASLPALPESPNRIAILALGLMLATIAGLLSASIKEYLDKTVRGVRSVVAAVGMPPLAVIPVVPPYTPHPASATAGSGKDRL